MLETLKADQAMIALIGCQATPDPRTNMSLIIPVMGGIFSMLAV